MSVTESYSGQGQNPETAKNTAGGTADVLLATEQLGVAFAANGQSLAAVRDFSLSLPQASITCLVGESGCGKSLACKAILRLVPQYAKLSGKILFEGQNLLELPEKALRKVRGAKIGMIFQEPMTSLNPVLTVGEQTAEPLRLHLGLSRAEAREKAVELFASVGIPSPAARYRDYPHQLSGGMRQRVMIAMALSCKPKLLLADEPTTALDATIQGQILRLIDTESRERAMSVLLITHDLGMAAEVADYAGVMYAGILVEYAPGRELFLQPMHPYTRGLVRSAPSRNSINLEQLPAIAGVVPTLAQMPQGCPFHPRCDQAMPVCRQKLPQSVFLDNGHRVACWLYAS